MTTPRDNWEQLAGELLDERDGALMDRVAALYTALDPVPPRLTDELIFAISLEAMHAELASLVEPDLALAAARGAGATQPTEVTTLTFSSESLTTMVTISASGPDRVRIDGWVTPAPGATLELRQGAAESRWATADEDGRFAFEDVPHGLTRFVVRPAEPEAHPPVVTPNVEI